MNLERENEIASIFLFGWSYLPGFELGWSLSNSESSGHSVGDLCGYLGTLFSGHQHESMCAILLEGQDRLLEDYSLTPPSTSLILCGKGKIMY